MFIVMSFRHSNHVRMKWREIIGEIKRSKTENLHYDPTDEPLAHVIITRLFEQPFYVLWFFDIFYVNFYVHCLHAFRLFSNLLAIDERQNHETAEYY